MRKRKCVYLQKLEREKWERRKEKAMLILAVIVFLLAMIIGGFTYPY